MSEHEEFQGEEMDRLNGEVKGEERERLNGDVKVESVVRLSERWVSGYPGQRQRT